MQEKQDNWISKKRNWPVECVAGSVQAEVKNTGKNMTYIHPPTFKKHKYIS